jgi:hypothetical protein
MKKHKSSFFYLLSCTFCVFLIFSFLFLPISYILSSHSNFLSPASYLLHPTSYLLTPNLALAGTIVSDPETVSVTAVVVGSGTVTQEPISGGSGELNGNLSIPQISVHFSGEAYPNATVNLLKNGTIVATVIADSGGLFDITLSEKYDGTMLYSLEALDTNNQKSILINYPLVVTAGYVTEVSGIIFPPTIAVDKVQATAGGYLTISGFAFPKKFMQVVFESEDKNTNKTFTLTAPSTGNYDITLPLVNMPLGNYTVYVKYPDDNRISELVRFIIGDSDISSINTTLNIPGDCNADGRIDLVDFSMMAFWYEKPNPPPCEDLNHDGIVNLTDFSILAFYWTD